MKIAIKRRASQMRETNRESIATGTDAERRKTSAVQGLLNMTSMNRDNFCHDGLV